MSIESLLLSDELVIGKDCYYDHSKYTYKGLNEEGKHIITKATKDGESTRYVVNAPHIPKLPLGLYFKNKRTGYFAELTDYTQMLGKMYYKLTIYEDVFKGYDHETFEDLSKDWDYFEENPFTDVDELAEKIGDLNQEINGYETQIREIKENQIRPIEQKREELYKQCKHDWYKYEEQEISKNYYEQECTCQICGKTKYNRFNRWN